MKKKRDSIGKERESTVNRFKKKRRLLEKDKVKQEQGNVSIISIISVLPESLVQKSRGLTTNNTSTHADFHIDGC